MEFKLYNKSYQRFIRINFGIVCIIFYPLILIGIIQSSNIAGIIPYLIIFIIFTLFLGGLFLKSENDVKRNIITLDKNSISFQGKYKKTYCHFKNIACIVVTFINVKTPIITIISFKEYYTNLKNGNYFPHQFIKDYSHSNITNDYIFFMYNKEAFEMIKSHCDAPIYDEYLLYKKGIEDAN